MTIRLLALGIALAAALPAAHADSFLEHVRGSAYRTTKTSAQVGDGGLAFTVDTLRLTLDARQQDFIAYAIDSAESAHRNQFFDSGSSSAIEATVDAGTLMTTRLDRGTLEFAFQSTGRSATSERDNRGWNDANLGAALADDRLFGHLRFDDDRGHLGFDFNDDTVGGFKACVTPVPEAGTVLLMSAGFGVLALALRSRRRA